LTWWTYNEGGVEETPLGFGSLSFVVKTICALMRRSPRTVRDKFKAWMSGSLFIKKEGELTGAAIRALKGAEEQTATRAYSAGVNSSPDDYCQWLFTKLVPANRAPTVDETLLILAIFYLSTYLILKRSPTLFASPELTPAGFVETKLRAVFLVQQTDRFLTTQDMVGCAFAMDIEEELMKVDALLEASSGEKVAPVAQTADPGVTAGREAAAAAQAQFDTALAAENAAAGVAAGSDAARSTRLLASMNAAARARTASKPESTVRYSATIMTRHIRFVLERISSNLHMNSVYAERQNEAAYHMWLALTGNAPAAAMASEDYRSAIDGLMKNGNLYEAMLFTYAGRSISPLPSVGLSDLLLIFKHVTKVLNSVPDGVKKITSAELISGVGLKRTVNALKGTPSTLTLFKSSALTAPLTFVPGETGQTAFFTAAPSEWNRAVGDAAAAWSALFNPVAASNVLTSARVGEQGYTSTLTDLRLREEHILALASQNVRITRGKTSGVFDYMFEVFRRPVGDNAVARAASAESLRAEEEAYGLAAQELIDPKANDKDSYDRTLYIADTRRALALSRVDMLGEGKWPAQCVLRESHITGKTWLAVSEPFARYVHTKASFSEQISTSDGPRTGKYSIDMNLARDEKIEAKTVMLTTTDEFARQRMLAIWLYLEAYMALTIADCDVADLRLALAPPLRELINKSRHGDQAKSIVIDLAAASRIVQSTQGKAQVKRITVNLQFHEGRIFGLVGRKDLEFITVLDPGIFRHLAITER
jgi:hypothetical protein